MLKEMRFKNELLFISLLVLTLASCATNQPTTFFSSETHRKVSEIFKSNDENEIQLRFGNLSKAVNQVWRKNWKNGDAKALKFSWVVPGVTMLMKEVWWGSAEGSEFRDWVLEWDPHTKQITFISLAETNTNFPNFNSAEAYSAQTRFHGKHDPSRGIQALYLDEKTTEVYFLGTLYQPDNSNLVDSKIKLALLAKQEAIKKQEEMAKQREIQQREQQAYENSNSSDGGMSGAQMFNIFMTALGSELANKNAQYDYNQQVLQNQLMHQMQNERAADDERREANESANRQKLQQQAQQRAQVANQIAQRNAEAGKMEQARQAAQAARNAEAEANRIQAAEKLARDKERIRQQEAAAQREKYRLATKPPALPDSTIQTGSYVAVNSSVNEKPKRNLQQYPEAVMVCSIPVGKNGNFRCANPLNIINGHLNDISGRRTPEEMVQSFRASCPDPHRLNSSSEMVWGCGFAATGFNNALDRGAGLGISGRQTFYCYPKESSCRRTSPNDD